MILLNPGPVVLSAAVRAALGGPDLCHREPEYADLQDRVRQAVLDVYGLAAGTWAPVLLAGSGTAAVEAMLASLVPQSGRVLIVVNGAYGERMVRIAAAHGIAHVALTRPWGAPVTGDDVAGHLAREGDVTHVAIVHHETTTGRLNDVAAVGAACRRHQAALLVDAVSSFGAEPIDFDAVTACAAGANKCLHAAPGLGFVVTRRVALAGDDEPRTVCLDLAAWCREQDARSTPFTPPVHLMYALDRALLELRDQGGRAARHERYRRLAERVRSGLASAGIEALLPTAETSVVLAAYRLPESMEYARLHDGLKERGFVVYAGQGSLARTIFRVSTMGEITEADIDRFLEAVREVMATTPALPS